MGSTAQDPPPLWRFIPLHAFNAPHEPATEAFRLNLQAFWQQLRGKPNNAAMQPENLPEIRNAPLGLLDRLVPTPDWTDALADALDEALPDPAEADHGPGVCPVVIAPPHSGIQPALRLWAERRDYRLMGPPAAGQILHDPMSWIQAWPSDEHQVVVLPNLEACYLRHPRGLEIVRWLVDHLWTIRQRCVLGCDSWAWAYLGHAARAHLLQPNPITLAPLDAEALECWIAQTVHSRTPAQLTFRRADNGRIAIRLPDAPEDSDSSLEFLVHLAAYSRGNPGVAWDIWRRSLAIAVDDDVKAEAQAEADQDRGRTIWVRPWEKVHRPTIDATSRELFFVLHTVLLHHGAAADQISDLLGLTRLEIEQQLQYLQSANVLALWEGRWLTVPGAYPMVRGILRGEGYLTDAL